MPFAKQRRPVTSSLQTIGHCGFTERQAEITMGWRQIKVELMAEPLRIATRHQSCPGGTTVRAADIGVGEADSTFGQCVDVWRGDVLASVDANIRVAHVVGDDDNNVRRPTLRLRHGATKAQKAEYDGDRCEYPWNSFHRYPPARLCASLNKIKKRLLTFLFVVCSRVGYRFCLVFCKGAFLVFLCARMSSVAILGTRVGAPFSACFGRSSASGGEGGTGSGSGSVPS